MLLDTIKKVFHNSNINNINIKKSQIYPMQSTKRTYLVQWHLKGKIKLSAKNKKAFYIHYLNFITFVIFN